MMRLVLLLASLASLAVAFRAAPSMPTRVSRRALAAPPLAMGFFDGLKNPFAEDEEAKQRKQAKLDAAFEEQKAMLARRRAASDAGVNLVDSPRERQREAVFSGRSFVKKDAEPDEMYSNQPKPTAGAAPPAAAASEDGQEDAAPPPPGPKSGAI